MKRFYKKRMIRLHELLADDDEGAKCICDDISGEDPRANYRNLQKSELLCQNHKSRLYDYPVDTHEMWWTNREALGRCVFSD